MDRCRTRPWSAAMAVVALALGLATVLAMSNAQSPYPVGHSGSNHCNCLRWTNWINADTPSHSGDWETLGPPDERGRPGTIHHVRPDICTVPVRMECRTVTGHTPWYLTKEKISYECNAQGKGFACLHKKQAGYKQYGDSDSDSSYVSDKSGDGYGCQDYEARVLCFYAGGGYDECPCLYWTKWYNNDNPTKGEGDEELIGYSIPKYVCEGNYEPVDVQCKTVAGHDVFHAGNRNVRCDLRGLTCYNGEQGKNCKCHDYEVRFLCPRFGSSYPVGAYGIGYEKSKGGYEKSKGGYEEGKGGYDSYDNYGGSKYESADSNVRDDDDVVIAGDYSKASASYKEAGTVHGGGRRVGYGSGLEEVPVPSYGGGGHVITGEHGYESGIGSEFKLDGEVGGGGAGYSKEEYGGGISIAEGGHGGIYGRGRKDGVGVGDGGYKSTYEDVGIGGGHKTAYEGAEVTGGYGSAGYDSAYDGSGRESYGHGSAYEGGVGGSHGTYDHGGSEYGGYGKYEDARQHGGGGSAYNKKEHYRAGGHYEGHGSKYGTSAYGHEAGRGPEAGYDKGGNYEAGYSKSGGYEAGYGKGGGYEAGYGKGGGYEAGRGYDAGYGKGGHGEYGSDSLVAVGDYSKGGGGGDYGYGYGHKAGSADGYDEGYGSDVDTYERPTYNTGEDDGYGQGGGALIGPLDVDYSDGGAYSDGEYYYGDKKGEYEGKGYDAYGKGGGSGGDSGHYESSSDYTVGGIRTKQRYKEGIEASSVNYKADYALEAKKAYGGEHGAAAVDEAEYHTHYGDGGGYPQADEGKSRDGGSSYRGSSSVKSDASYGPQDLANLYDGGKQDATLAEPLYD